MNNILWDNTILGEFFIFGSEEKVKEFFCKTAFSIEELEMCGVSIKEITDDLDDVCYDYEREKAYVMPVFNPNPYMGYEEESAHHAMSNIYKPENMILDKEIYNKYPLVAYIYKEESYSRLGEEKIMIFNVKHVDDMLTVGKVNRVVEKYGEQWIEKNKRLVEFDKIRNEHSRLNNGEDV